MSRMAGWGLAGMIAGVVIALGICVLIGYFFEVSQFEGAYAMAVIFAYIPLGGVVGAVAGAVLAAMSRR